MAIILFSTNTHHCYVQGYSLFSSFFSNFMYLGSAAAAGAGEPKIGAAGVAAVRVGPARAAPGRELAHVQRLAAARAERRGVAARRVHHHDGRRRRRRHGPEGRAAAPAVQLAGPAGVVVRHHVHVGVAARAGRVRARRRRQQLNDLHGRRQHHRRRRRRRNDDAPGVGGRVHVPGRHAGCGGRADLDALHDVVCL